MAAEPDVSVGILWNTAISFLLEGNYLCSGKKAPEKNRVSYQNGRIVWNGEIFDTLLFEPQDDETCFVLEDVVIGINFHWERKENQTFKGALKLIVENEMITAINLIPVEDYLTSVISSEMSATASLELLKSHAVISRSWLIAQMNKSNNAVKHNSFVETENEIICWYDREDHVNYDVCADDHCQRYQGITRTFGNLETVKQAISETRGQALVYEDTICDARFYKCCGGVTEEFQNCWEDVEYPYLKAVRDEVDMVGAKNFSPLQTSEIPDLAREAEAREWILSNPSAFCNTRDEKVLSQVLNNYDTETVDFYRWTVSYTKNELSKLILKRSGIDFGEIQDLIPLQRGASGRIFRLKIVGSKKTMIIGKELEIRRILSESHLYSSAFIVEKQQDTFVLHGAGWGHGVGLCQIGAAVMGEEGYAYDEILLHYYRGAEIRRIY
ncbi:MAG: SpoIID/LytB domain-containing protein [Tannerella sp.]|nr:SpoIID/LytB domain-containing protein [Tannerella sp.]